MAAVREPVLEAVDLCYTYPDGTVALENLSLIIPAGAKVALLGANGAGKTTLFLLLAGLARPAAGEIRFRGAAVGRNRRELLALRRSVGLVFQDPEAQIFAPTVWEEVAFGPVNQGLRGETLEERVKAALAATALWELRDKAPHFLSYGQKKRLCLAAVLALAPAVMLLDEPTAGLDVEQTHRVLGILEELHRAGRTLVLATHDVDMAYTWADTVYIFGRGQVLGGGAPEVVFADAALIRRAGLRLPVVLSFYQALRERGLVAGGKVPRDLAALVALLPPVAAGVGEGRGGW
ncbi:energy-coupling factor ABC transporter ATP-binding protein [Thermodesulfitimonas autotrophica]|uniref:energy-coupling factor ABC transporter ATP-binding protein n=1 Tax=Thermodesulfitimonas autotrophica TaxID=1894989 RepID=UPI002FE268AD